MTDTSGSMASMRELMTEIEALRASIGELERERDTLKEMLRKISEGQDPVHVLTQGMGIVIEREAQLARTHAHLEAQRRETYLAVEREQAAKQQLAEAQAEIIKLKGAKP